MWQSDHSRCLRAHREIYCWRGGRRSSSRSRESPTVKEESRARRETRERQCQRLIERTLCARRWCTVGIAGRRGPIYRPMELELLGPIRTWTTVALYWAHIEPGPLAGTYGMTSGQTQLSFPGVLFLTFKKIGAPEAAYHIVREESSLYSVKT